jgi:dipeptidyl aminopeptidase/acylaminoacyl peptidase
MRMELGPWFMAVLAASSALFGVGTSQAAPPPRLEAYLSYPFIDDLVPAQSGSAVAWVLTQKGVRNVWIAEAPDFQPRQLTQGTADDGQQLVDLSFSPDAKVLAWSRGGAEHNSWANDAPAPDPTSSPQQPHAEIWTSLSGGAPKKVAEDGDEPAISVKGRLAYLKDGQVWTADPVGKTAPARLFYDRGKDGDLQWSPDGSKLTFVSHRGDHSFIGVYLGPDHPLVWLSPSTAFDDDPAWSPDSQRIAFSRRDGKLDILASPLVEKPAPFSLWIGSAIGGDAKTVWRSPNTLNGSYPQVPGGIFLSWGAGEKLVFRAEMDGWPHLYAVPASGGIEPALLTPGEFMVEHVSMTPDRQTLFYSANAGAESGDIDRRHLFSVSIDHGAPRALTPGTGLEWTPEPIGGNRIVYISSTATSPMHVVMAEADGRKSSDLETNAAPYAPGRFVAPKPVTMTSADGLVIHGQLFTPPDATGKRPALIFVHGGPPRQMLLGWSYMDYYTHAYAMNQYLASRGFVVLSVNYRLGIGYGRAFQHPAKGGAAGNAEYQDVLAGAKFLQALPSVDPTRIGIWGGSYGGLLTAQALARNSDIFKAGVDFHGVHDWSFYPGFAKRPQRYEQGDTEIALKSAFDSSPESAIKGWTSPVLLIDGDDDRNVPFSQTVDLARRLSAQGTPFEELILPNEIHGFLRYDSWLLADTAADRFLESKLSP